MVICLWLLNNGMHDLHAVSSVGVLCDDIIFVLLFRCAKCVFKLGKNVLVFGFIPTAEFCLRITQQTVGYHPYHLDVIPPPYGIFHHTPQTCGIDFRLLYFPTDITFKKKAYSHLKGQLRIYVAYVHKVNRTR